MYNVQATVEAFSLKREHPALQNMKFLFAPLDPEPDFKSGSESTDLI
jgi:hypothetical protein